MIDKEERESIRARCRIFGNPVQSEIIRLLDELEEVRALASKIERGCDCEYDYRCGRCEAVVDLRTWLMDAGAVTSGSLPAVAPGTPMRHTAREWKSSLAPAKLRRAIRLKGTDVVLELSRATQIKITKGKQFIHIDQMKDGSYRLVWTTGIVDEWSEVEALEMVREDPEEYHVFEPKLDNMSCCAWCGKFAIDHVWLDD